MSRIRLGPNRNTLGLAAIFAAVGYAGASQSNAAVYLLGFVLAGVSLVSLVHAWSNLRGLQLALDPVGPVFSGEEFALGVVARTHPPAVRAHVALRLQVPGAPEVAAIGEIPAGQPRRVDVPLSVEGRGRVDSIGLVLSTFFPLGFFKASRRITLEAPFLVYPKPSGARPLPRARTNRRSSRDGQRSEGEDFAGTRAYQLGQSQRHIDWKAAARGQALQVKQWAGEADEILTLEWEALPTVGWEARLSQLARWVMLAEQTGAHYSLAMPAQGPAAPIPGTALSLQSLVSEAAGKLRGWMRSRRRTALVAQPAQIQPAVRIPAGRGQVHFERCMEALALYPAAPGPQQPGEEAIETPDAPLPSPRKPARAANSIQTLPLAGMCLALVLATLPLLAHVALWAVLIFAGAVCLRLWIASHGRRMPSMPVKVLVLVVGMGGILLSYGSLLGIEPGLGILFVLLSLKLLESNSPRDFQSLTLLGWFMAACGLFFTQSLMSWVFAGVVCLLMAASLIRFHWGPGGTKGALRLTGILLLQGLPIILLLFLFFPRTHGGFQFAFSSAIVGTGGMSERMEPGSVSSLALSSAPVFRVEFPDGNRPLASQLYWRGGVLWKGEGLTWVRGDIRLSEPPFADLEGPAIRQRIVLEPSGARWIFALDRPASIGPKMTYEPGGYLQSTKPVLQSLRYEVTSRPENRERRLLPQHRVAALGKPPLIAANVQTLVNSWRAGERTDTEVVASAFRFFETRNFLYTLTPGKYSGDTLEQFLFERRSGFCEHYAGAFATLMRIAGVPSRVVIGFLGGEFNALGKYMIVRQSDAHAWCEVWLEGKGWVRIDPVDAIAPGRIQGGMGSFVESRRGMSGPDNSSSGRAGAGAWLQTWRMAWDGINYQWDLRVLNFDEDTQRTILGMFGLEDHGWLAALVWVVLVAILLLGLIAFWLQRPGPLGAPGVVAREYAVFCRKLAAAGCARAQQEGALDFSRRAATRFPARREEIEHIGALYLGLRYGKTPPPLADFQREVRAFSKQKLPA